MSISICVERKLNVRSLFFSLFCHRSHLTVFSPISFGLDRYLRYFRTEADCILVRIFRYIMNALADCQEQEMLLFFNFHYERARLAMFLLFVAA